MLDTTVLDVAGGTSVMEGVIDAEGVGGGVGAGVVEGAFVDGVFVAAMALLKLIWPGLSRSVLVSVCAGRRSVHDNSNPRTVRVDRHDLPPHKTVKKGIS